MSARAAFGGLARLATRRHRVPDAIRQAAVYAAALFLSKAVGFAMIPVFTGYLVPADYGRLDVLQTLADLLSIVIGLGLADTLFRFAGATSDARERRIVAANVFGMAILAGVVSMLVLQLAAPAIANALPGAPTLVQTRLILANLAISVCILVPMCWLRLTEKPWQFFAGAFGRVALQAVLSAVLLAAGHGITGVMIAGLVASAVVAGSMVMLQWRDTGIAFDRVRMRAFAAYGLPLVLAGIAGFLMGSFDRWILADHVGTARMAEYALAVKLALIVAMLVQPFEMWWLARRFAVVGGDDGLRRAAGFGAMAVALAILAAVAVAAAGPALVRLVAPPAYHGAAILVPLLAGLAALRAATTALNLGLLSGRTTRRVLLIDGAAALVAISGYALTIPSLGATGAIVSTGVALSLRLVLTCHLGHRTLPVPYPWGRMLVLASVALAAIAATMVEGQGAAGLVVGALGVVATAGTALALGLFGARR